VAEFIERRDGYPADPGSIFLTNGASTAIAMVLNLILCEPSDAVLVPIPQYPIYSALIELYGAKAVGYYLDEESGWRLDQAELERALGEARDQGLRVRGMVVINPGNPTAQCLPEDVLVQIARFCREHRLVLMADEVYQENVYEGAEFVSLKKVVRDLGADFDDFELVSFHSTSKGILGECGRRGGYMELCGFHPEVQAELYKLASVGLCSNLDGQVMTYLMVRTPREGEPSYPRYREEYQSVYESLRRKAALVRKTLDDLDGVHCQPVEGSMYTFPRLDLPEKAIAEAEAEGVAPDLHYCRSLLLETGICTVPGSGFGQREGTHHLRMTFLPPEDRLGEALERLAAHHRGYMARYA
jgi:alanine transaminase